MVARAERNARRDRMQRRMSAMRQRWVGGVAVGIWLAGSVCGAAEQAPRITTDQSARTRQGEHGRSTSGDTSTLQESAEGSTQRLPSSVSSTRQPSLSKGNGKSRVRGAASSGKMAASSSKSAKRGLQPSRTLISGPAQSDSATSSSDTTASPTASGTQSSDATGTVQRSEESSSL